MGRILVVDDERYVCTSISKYLRRIGYKVFTAHNGAEAIRALKERRPHVVLLDIRMPELDGLDVLRRMKEIDPKTAVIMVTAVQCNDAGLEALMHGADGYLTKPIDPDYLKEVVLAKVAHLTA